MAAGIEIKGSRQTRVDGKMTHGVMLFVSDDGTTGIPVVGTTFFTPPSGSEGTGIVSRRCVSVATDPEVLPGLHYSVAQFSAFKAYS